MNSNHCSDWVILIAIIYVAKVNQQITKQASMSIIGRKVIRISFHVMNNVNCKVTNMELHRKCSSSICIVRKSFFTVLFFKEKKLLCVYATYSLNVASAFQ